MRWLCKGRTAERNEGIKIITEVQACNWVKGLATLYLVHKIANLPPAGRASDTVQCRMSLQLKVFQKDDLVEEMQRRATKIVRRVEILLSREKKHKSCC